MMSQRIFNSGNIVTDIRYLSIQIISLASTFYKNVTAVEQQFTSVMFTNCMVVHFSLCHSVYHLTRLESGVAESLCCRQKFLGAYVSSC